MRFRRRQTSRGRDRQWRFDRQVGRCRCSRLAPCVSSVRSRPIVPRTRACVEGRCLSSRQTLIQQRRNQNPAQQRSGCAYVTSACGLLALAPPRHLEADPGAEYCTSASKQIPDAIEAVGLHSPRGLDHDRPADLATGCGASRLTRPLQVAKSPARAPSCIRLWRRAPFYTLTAGASSRA